VMYRGLSVAGARITGPVTLLLIVVDIGITQLFAATSWKQSIQDVAKPFDNGLKYRDDRLQMLPVVAIAEAGSVV
jgi:hypothetical protein